MSEMTVFLTVVFELIRTKKKTTVSLKCRV